MNDQTEFTNSEEQEQVAEEKSVSPSKNLQEKMKPIYGGLSRVSGKDRIYEYKIEEDFVPPDDILKEYFQAKKDYLEDLARKAKDNIGRQREIDQAAMRAGVACETLKGKSDRKDLVIAEFVGLGKACEEYKTTDDIHKDVFLPQAEYFRKIAENIAKVKGLVVPLDSEVGVTDREIYPVDYIGMVITTR
jgi:hypothetical protein